MFCLLLFLAASLSSCYNQASQTPDAWSLTDKQQDSISFYSTHHYTQNFNFVVKGDSMVLYELRSDERGTTSHIKVKTLSSSLQANVW